MSTHRDCCSLSGPAGLGALSQPRERVSLLVLACGNTACKRLVSPPANTPTERQTHARHTHIILVCDNTYAKV